MARNPTPDITYTIDHWPPTVEDLLDAFDGAEEWANVSQVIINDSDFRAIDFRGDLSANRSGVMALWGAQVVRVEKSYGTIQLSTEKVTLRGPKFGDSVRVVLAAPRA